MVSMTLEHLFKKTVFLFGAGASVHAGCKSSKGMLLDLKQSIIQLPPSHECKSHFLAIYDFIIQSLAYQNALKDPERKLVDLSNIEDFIAVLRQMIDREFIVPSPLIGSWNSKITSWELKRERVFQDFLDYIYEKLINDWTKFDDEKAKELVQPFRNLINSDNFDLRIFSLNYDLIFERSFNSDEESLVYTGFSQDRWVGDFEDPHLREKIKLFKLHGSLDWYFDKEEEEVLQGYDSSAKPLIVFGSGPKIQSYDPFLSLLSGFRSHLRDASLFVTVGYSFQDKYINNILIQSLSSEVNKQLLVVDPFLEDEKMKFIQRIEDFQSTRSLTDIISFTQISPDKVEFAKMTAKDFFEQYFTNGCAPLKQVLQLVEQGEKVF